MTLKNERLVRLFKKKTLLKEEYYIALSFKGAEAMVAQSIKHVGLTNQICVQIGIE